MNNYQFKCRNFIDTNKNLVITSAFKFFSPPISNFVLSLYYILYGFIYSECELNKD
jgi:hypothetical protein